MNILQLYWLTTFQLILEKVSQVLGKDKRKTTVTHCGYEVFITGSIYPIPIARSPTCSLSACSGVEEWIEQQRFTTDSHAYISFKKRDGGSILTFVNKTGPKF